jgi:FkbH-like protein
VTELIQRTNQLNFSGSKHPPEKIDELLTSRGDRYVLRCEDRYGCYGTVGFALVDHAAEEIRVDEFMLSCRVQGRRIEQAFFAYLAQAVGASDTRRLFVRFRPTGGNAAASAVLAQAGFRYDAVREGWIFDLGERTLACEVVEVAAGDRPGDRHLSPRRRSGVAA